MSDEVTIKTLVDDRDKSIRDLLSEREKAMLHMQKAFENKFEGVSDRLQKLETWQSHVVGMIAVLVFLSGLVGGVLVHLLKK